MASLFLALSCQSVCDAPAEVREARQGILVQELDEWIGDSGKLLRPCTDYCPRLNEEFLVSCSLLEVEPSAAMGGAAGSGDGSEGYRIATNCVSRYPSCD